MTDVVLHFTVEQLEQIEILAQHRGYESIESYVFSLIVRDARKRLEEIAQNGHGSAPPKPEPPAGPSPDSFEASFQQALRNVLKNNSNPEDPWNMVDDE